MSFDLLDRPLLYIPVTWAGLTAGDEGKAKEVEHAIEVQVEMLDSVDADEWIEESSKQIEDKDERTAHELASFKRVAKGWRGVKTNGRVADFTDDNVRAILRVPGFAYAFALAYASALQGKAKAREGNSDGSLAHGRAGEPTDETTKAATSPN